jgi:chorismate mutase
MTLDELRRQIDRLDERLVELLNERAHCALEIGKLKRALGLRSTSPTAKLRCAITCDRTVSRSAVRSRAMPPPAVRAHYRRGQVRIERATARGSGTGGAVAMVVVMAERATGEPD